MSKITRYQNVSQCAIQLYFKINVKKLTFPLILFQLCTFIGSISDAYVNFFQKPFDGDFQTGLFDSV